MRAMDTKSGFQDSPSCKGLYRAPRSSTHIVRVGASITQGAFKLLQQEADDAILQVTEEHHTQEVQEGSMHPWRSTFWGQHTIC